MTPLPEINKEDIGRRIREVRIDKGLTQEEFGKRIDYSKSQVWFAENRRTDSSNPVIQKICTVFGISRDWLLTGKGEMYGFQEEEIDDELLDWLRSHPEVIRELKVRSGRR